MTRPPGDLQNKSPGATHQCRSFPLKRRTEVAGLCCVWFDSRDAGRAAQPGPFTSVLKERGGKENLRPGLFCALDKKTQKETLKRKLHPGYIRGYLLTLPSLENNIARNFRKTQVRTFLFFAVTRFASVACLLLVGICNSPRKLQMVTGDPSAGGNISKESPNIARFVKGSQRHTMRNAPIFGGDSGGEWI